MFESHRRLPRILLVLVVSKGFAAVELQLSLSADASARGNDPYNRDIVGRTVFFRSQMWS